MREVLSLHIGQAGVQLGADIWELYCSEHGLDLAGRASPLLGAGDNFTKSVEQTPIGNGTQTVFNYGDVREVQRNDNLRNGSDAGSFFSENTVGVFTPRALFLDLEPSVNDEMKNGRLKTLFPSNRMINDEEDAANNYARGYHSCGKKMIGRAVAALQSMAEASDRLQGFMTFHSFGGGTGSGFYSLLNEEMENQFSKTSFMDIAVFPSPTLSTAVVEPYNTVLATSATLDLAGSVFLTDNEALFGICQKLLDVDEPTYRNLNRLLAQTVSSITSSLRFKGSLNADFTDFQTNLVPYPKIHFPVMSYAPIHGKNSRHATHSVVEMTSQVFEPQNRMKVKCDSENGKYIACCLLYRGNVTPKDVNQAISQTKQRKGVEFVNWSPTGFKIGINHQPPVTFPQADFDDTDKAMCLLANTTAIRGSWGNINAKFHTMLTKKAFLHWYEQEGMSVNDFYTAQENLIVLEDDYTDLELKS